MATIDDVLRALANQIQTIVYPNGVDSAAIVSADVAIFPGWPNAKTLDDFVVRAGNVMISVYAGDAERNVSRGLGERWDEVSNDGVMGTILKETKRQQKQIQIVVWANTPEIRSAVAGPIDAMLADVTRFAVDEFSSANIAYVNSRYTDALQNEGIYRCDLFYQVEFASTIVANEQVITSSTVVLDVET